MLGRDPRLQQRVEAALVRAEADDAGRVSPLRWVPIDLIAQAALLEAATARPTQAQLDDAIVRLTKRGR